MRLSLLTGSTEIPDMEITTTEDNGLMISISGYAGLNTEIIPKEDVEDFIHLLNKVIAELDDVDGVVLSNDN